MSLLSGRDAELFVWRWKQSPGRRFWRGLFPPRRDRALVARRPRCPASNIWSRTICWGCQSPHAPRSPDLSKESPMGNQAVSGLLEWFWSPFEKKCCVTKLYYHRGGSHSCCYINSRLCSATLVPSLWSCVAISSILSTWATVFTVLHPHLHLILLGMCYIEIFYIFKSVIF